MASAFLRFLASSTIALVLAATLFAHPCHGAELKPTAGGVEINAGSLGTFTLTYPEFVDAAHAPVHKVVEARVNGNAATVRYAGGAECEVTVVGAEIRLALKSVPSDVKSWKMSALIDISFGKGGQWKIGEGQGAFPAEKPKVPQIVSIHATQFSLKNAQGQSLGITTPELSFQQLTDNREWNWAIYQWQFIVPYFPDHFQAVVRVTSDLASVTKLVDRFGQSLKDSFPNKLGSLEELKADVASEKAYYESITPPAFDAMGGLPGSREKLGLRATGFFHVEKKAGRTLLVNPEGNAFFHLGLCGFGPNDDYTYVKGREGIYEWLPKADGDYATAFRPGDGDAHFSFYLANVIEKFGAPYDYDTHVARMIGRVRKWGFNSIGAFTDKPPTACEKHRFPYVAHLPINEWEGVPRIPGAHEVWDPYDAATEQKMEENMARVLPAKSGDPLLIGWFIVNEPRYDELPRVLPALPGRHACKQKLVQALQTKYGTVEALNSAWKSAHASFQAAQDSALAVTTDSAKADVQSFCVQFLEVYFAQVERLFRKYDGNHLLLGSRLQPVTMENEALCRIMGRHLDVVSYNYYTFGFDAAALRRYHEWTGGRPLMLSEFFWASPKDSGLLGGREVSSQRERGLAYRNYVEQAAALGFVVGIEWFTLVDQATTGRWFSKYNGESYNTGLFSVADRPWKDLVAEMMKTNHTIYDVLLGARPAFVWDDPRFQVPASR